MLSAPSDLRNPPARDTGSLLAQLLDFPEEDDAHAQPLSAEQLAQQLAFFSEAEFNFESAPPATSNGSTYLQRTGLLAATDHADSKPATAKPQSPSSSSVYHTQTALPHPTPAFPLQSHQLFGSAVQPPANHQVVWGPNGTAFLVQPSIAPGQPSVMVPLQLAAPTIASTQPLVFSAPQPSLASSNFSTTRPADPLARSLPFPASNSTIPAPLVTVPPVPNASTAVAKPPRSIDLVVAAPSSKKSAESSSTPSSRNKRSTATRNSVVSQLSADSSVDPQQTGSAHASHLDNDDDDNDSELPQSKRPKTGMDEEKRRRNTEASARFRLRKKAKEQALERTASELAARLDQFERRTKELETENAWLRGILVDRDGHDRAATAARYAALAAAAGIQPPHSAAVSTIPAIPPGFTAGSFCLTAPNSGLAAFASSTSHSGDLSVVNAIANPTTQP